MGRSSLGVYSGECGGRELIASAIYRPGKDDQRGRPAGKSVPIYPLMDNPHPPGTLFLTHILIVWIPYQNTDYSDTWFQRAFMDIADRYPKKVLHTQGVMNTRPALLGR